MQNVNVIFNVTAIGSNAVVPDWFDFTQAGNSVIECLQCVHTLLNTPIGSVVGNRQIGVDYSFIDKPMSIAMNMILAAVPTAVARWEPRVTLKDISFQTTASDAVSLGKLQCNLTIGIP